MGSRIILVGVSLVGLAIVDESVYALNEGRLNMQEVFDELEQRFMEPQVETHSDDQWWWQWGGYGAYELFEEMGLQIVSSGSVTVPTGWIESHQKADGSWEPVGFIHHKEMVGGAGGGYPLTAYVVIALTDYGRMAENWLQECP